MVLNMFRGFQADRRLYRIYWEHLSFQVNVSFANELYLLLGTTFTLIRDRYCLKVRYFWKNVLQLLCFLCVLYDRADTIEEKVY